MSHHSFNTILCMRAGMLLLALLLDPDFCLLLNNVRDDSENSQLHRCVGSNMREVYIMTERFWELEVGLAHDITLPDGTICQIGKK